MKKIISLVLVLMLCVALAAPAMATYAPSVTYEAVADTFVVEAEVGGEDVTETIVVTTELDAIEENTAITEEEREAFLDLLAEIKEGTMVLPVEEGFEVREVVYLSMDIEEGDVVTVTATFDLGVAAGAEIVMLAFIDGEWVELGTVINNGDGTITVTFDFAGNCPIAFAVKE